MKDYRLINVGKFFAMFCVIMMHSIKDNNNLIFKLVQIGCMAYFFFVSGFLFKDKDLFKNEDGSIIEVTYNVNPFKYIARNIRTLLYPYLVCSVIGILSIYLWPDWYPEVTAINIFESIFIYFQPIGFGLVWFLAVLFTVKISFYILWQFIKLFKNKTIISILLIASLIGLNFLTQYLIQYYKLGNIRLPYKIDTTIVALMFYIIGFLFKYWKLNKIFNYKWVSLILFIIFRVLCSYIEINYIPGKTNICDFEFGNNFYIYFINQLFGVLSFLSLGSLLRDIKLIDYLGRNNLYIYLSHSYILWIIEEIYGKIIGETHYSFYILKEILLLSIITYIITIIFSEILRKLLNYIKNS